MSARDMDAEKLLSPRSASLTERLAAVKVAVVGDVMLDRYWSGSVDRISPESPVPVVDVKTTDVRMGGAANVAANVAGLGAHCTLVSLVGDDEAGRLLCDMASRSGIAARITTSAEIRTTEKLRIVARNQQLLRVDFESRPTHELLIEALGVVRECMSSIDTIILSDYGKGGLTHIEAMINMARESNVRVVVDPKGNDYDRYRGATLITPNLREFEQSGGILRDERIVDASAFEMVSRLGVGGILVTQSERGMTLYTEDGGKVESPALAREVFDVSGAGDTVAAVVGVCLAAGLEPEQVLKLANRAAGQVVGKFGTVPVDIGELDLEDLDGGQD
jgi:rfaE bifunctional protein kinase chain/domain